MADALRPTAALYAALAELFDGIANTGATGGYLIDLALAVAHAAGIKP